LATLHPLYDRLNVDPDDQNHLLGPKQDVFRNIDYTIEERSEEWGDNPIQIVLMLLTLSIFSIGLLRSRSEFGFVLTLALSLCIGFVVFAAITRWSFFAVRYYVPLLVLWTPLIALALSKSPRSLARAVGLVIVITSIPQLLDNSARSLIHPRYHFSSELDPYFIVSSPTQQHRLATQYRGLANAISQSSCTEVGIANWILVEYPIWRALDESGWSGTLADVNVENESRHLEKKNFHPCSLIRQQTPSEIVVNKGNISLRLGNLALWIDPSSLAKPVAVPRS
jgi:hypothetical protein